MVKSKFPGKPSKLVNRKLTRTSGNTSVHENEGVKLAEDISLGLSVFKEIFGSDEEDEVCKLISKKLVCCFIPVSTY